MPHFHQTTETKPIVPHMIPKQEQKPITRIIVTCDSNTCRSAILAKMLMTTLSKISLTTARPRIENAAVINGSSIGEPAKRDAAAYVQKHHGISLSGHRAKHLSSLNPCGTDLVVIVEAVHETFVSGQHPGIRILLVRRGKGIDNPYDEDSPDFARMVRQISEAVTEIAAMLQ